MARFARVKRRLRRARGVERFVRLVVLGGVALVAGLWTATLLTPWSVPWVFGSVLVLLGIGMLAGGIWIAVDY